MRQCWDTRRPGACTYRLAGLAADAAVRVLGWHIHLGHGGRGGQRGKACGSARERGRREEPQRCRHAQSQRRDSAGSCCAARCRRDRVAEGARDAARGADVTWLAPACSARRAQAAASSAVWRAVLRLRRRARRAAWAWAAWRVRRLAAKKLRTGNQPRQQAAAALARLGARDHGAAARRHGLLDLRRERQRQREARDSTDKPCADC